MNDSSKTNVNELVPLLYVDDVDCSVRFYRDKLGFRLVTAWEPDGKLTWCRMERDGAAVMLQQACEEEDGTPDQRGRGVGFFFNCDDADEFHREVSANGLTVSPPELAFYGMSQVFVKDPDGFQLCFQSAQSSE